ncbi:MAG: efflux RND transporter periplasmic adaptor subunit [Gammaproteobacteria bacterium]|nr:efflux RND transporter periplasmic adaptor subunit [Gammaproteobacteria bacterium]
MQMIRGTVSGIPPCLLLAALVLSGCDSADDAAVMPMLTVEVVDSERRDVPLTIEMVGTTLGAQDVPIRARVEGFLETMNFREGRFVKKGDLLYTIDAQPFQAKLVEAQSNLAGAQTRLAKAEADLGRIRPLAEMDAVSQQQLDAAVAQDAAARAGVRAVEAQVKLAEIELSYTRISAPIDGLIGLSKAKPGEFVGREPNPVVLNTLSDIDPIRVRFSISEREYLILARHYLETRDGTSRVEENPPDLELILADGTLHEHPGTATAAAQSINAETGTYSVDATFPNPKGLLLPGQFARVRAPYRTLEDVVVVPKKSLVELQGRYQLYVVTTDNTVEVRAVTLGPATGSDVVIETGLDEGESVIVEGTQKVRVGMVVNPRPASSSTALPPLQET